MTTVATDLPSPRTDEQAAPTPSQNLVGWVMSNVTRWRQIRDMAYKERWDDYYNTWRGKWVPGDKNKNSERSKLISPASMSAVDLTVAEIIEAIFARENFMDVPSGLNDQQKGAAEKDRDQLLADLYRDGIITTMIEIVLNGALYGTGIAKIAIDIEKVSQPKMVPVNAKQPDGAKRVQKITAEKVKIYPVPVEPGQLVVDPAASHIDQMLGVAHEMRVPLHKIWQRQREGTYYSNVQVGQSPLEWSTANRSENDTGYSDAKANLITEWHGLVPTRYLTGAVQEIRDGIKDDPTTAEIGDGDMTEAIVTIADGGSLLRAIQNPSIMDDRALIAYQHDNVPNRFWGRGVMEKAFHPQKALDAELRSRSDSLAWVGNPMLAGDVTKLPPRMNLNAWPGKFWGTRGNPSDIIKDFRFGDVNSSTFEHTAELGRMLQDATGAVDPANLRANVRDESAAGGAITVSGLRKRAKRTMYNIEDFLTTMIRRILWRKMQFEPEKYQTDYEFEVKGTMGMVARELEQQMLVQLMQYTDKGTQPYLLILKAIFEQSSSPVKTELMQTIDQMMQPNPQQQQQQQMAQQIAIQTQVEQLQNLRADTALKLANGDKAKADTMLSVIEGHFKQDEALVENLRIMVQRGELGIQQQTVDATNRKLDIEQHKAVTDRHDAVTRRIAATKPAPNQQGG